MRRFFLSRLFNAASLSCHLSSRGVVVIVVSSVVNGQGRFDGVICRPEPSLSSSYITSLSALDVVVVVVVVVMSSRTDPDDDVVDVTWFSALDVVEIMALSLSSSFVVCGVVVVMSLLLSL